MAKIYQGTHSKGCHKCGGFPGGAKLGVKQLFLCNKCGFYTCNKHVKGLGRKCPNCNSGTKFMQVVSTTQNVVNIKRGGMAGKTTSKHKPAKHSGNPDVVGEDNNGNDAGGGSSSSESNNASTATSRPTIGIESAPPEKITTYRGFGSSDTRVQNAIKESTNDKSLQITKSNLETGESLSEAGVGYRLSNVKGEGSASSIINSAINAFNTSDQEQNIDNNSAVGADEDDSIISIADPTMGIADELGNVEDDANLDALVDMERLICDHKDGNKVHRSTLTDSYFRMSGTNSFYKYITTPEYNKGVSTTLLSIDASNEVLLKDFLNYLNNNANIFGAIGIAPQHVSPRDIKQLEERVIPIIKKHNKILAIGAIGLDLHYAPYTYKEQEALLRKQLSLAIEIEKPVFLTSKNADAELYNIVKEIMLETPFKGVITPTIRTPELLKIALDFNFHILLRPEITHPAEGMYRECINMVAKERLLLASGEEFIAPVTSIGKWNSPRYINDTLIYLANMWKYREEDRHQLVDLFAKNFLQLMHPYDKK